MSPSILIVDDSIYHRRLLEKLIRAEHPGYQLYSYDPVAKGMPGRDFEWGDYNLILLDYQLNNGTAIDWLNAYSHLPGYPPTIIVTGEGSESIAVQAIKAGAANYLTKDDINATSLNQAVNDVLIETTEQEVDRNAETQKVDEKTEPQTQHNWDQLKKDAPMSPSDEWPFTLDDIFGGNARIKYYKVTGYIGKGGMGTVFRAKREQYDETVALKLLHGQLTDDDTLISRFIEEYSVIEDLTHPNIVKVFAQGFSDDHAYIIMEYLSEGHLRKKILRGMERKEAMSYGYQIVDALCELHRHGIVHRDLKPLNVLFRETHVPVLVDFGVAKDLTREDLNLTTQGNTVGTPVYSSPEQIMGKELDHRSDQYAFGSMFYEMLTGRKIFTGKTVPIVAMKHLEEDPPPLPDEYSDLQPIMNRLLAKNASGRYDKTEDLLAELSKFK